MPLPDEQLDFSVLPNGSKIRSMREARAITQGHFADSALISVRALGKAENNNRVMMSTLWRIADAFKCEVNDLIADESEAVPFTQEMLEAIPLPVFFKDSNGIYRGCNDRFCKYLDRKRGQIIGKSVYDVAPHTHAKMYENRDKKLFDAPGEQIYQARVVAGAVERKVMFYKGTYPVKSTNKVEGIIGVIVDITDLPTFTPEVSTEE